MKWNDRATLFVFTQVKALMSMINTSCKLGHWIGSCNGVSSAMNSNNQMIISRKGSRVRWVKTNGLRSRNYMIFSRHVWSSRTLIHCSQNHRCRRSMGRRRSSTLDSGKLNIGSLSRHRIILRLIISIVPRFRIKMISLGATSLLHNPKAIKTFWRVTMCLLSMLNGSCKLYKTLKCSR